MRNIAVTVVVLVLIVPTVVEAGSTEWRALSPSQDRLGGSTGGETLLNGADAGLDQTIYEGEAATLDGSGSQAPAIAEYWSDSFENASKTSEMVNATIENGSIVLTNVSFPLSHNFSTDPGFVLEDDQPQTDIWWEPSQEVIRWHTQRGDPADHYEKLVGYLPYAITDAMSFSVRVNHMYWRADTWSVSNAFLLQKNESYRTGSKIGDANNTLVVNVYGGDPPAGDVDLINVKLYDDLNGAHTIILFDYDKHYYELFDTTVTWNPETQVISSIIRDPLDNIITSGSAIITENFTFDKYGVGGLATGLSAGGEGFTDNMSISAYGYQTPGWVTSETIIPSDTPQSWGVLNVSAVEPVRTQIEIQILDEFGTPIVSGIRPGDCPCLLDGVLDPSIYPRIMLKAILSTDRNETPSLLDWNVSYYVGNPIISYHWDVNHLVDADVDGNYTNDVDLVGEVVSHVYGDDGLYKVHLTIEDSLNETSIDSCNITIFNVNPSVSVTPPSSPKEGVPLTFNASAYDPGSDDLTFIWDWGDGSNESWTYYSDGLGPDPPNSPDVNPMTVAGQWNHTYGHGGPYLVNLTVVDDDGGSDSVQLLLDVLNVGPTPVIDITQPNPMVEGSSVLLGGYFDDPSWLDNHTVFWDFGDGQFMQGNYTPGAGSTHHIVENVTHVYGDDGVFEVTLNVTDDYGTYNMSSVDVFVLNEPPAANISCPTKVTRGGPFQCSSTATDPGSDDLVFDWDWDDGSSHITTTYYNNGVTPDPDPSPGPTYPFSANDVATHSYGLIGNYTVLLNVTDDDGGYVVVQFRIEVVGPPETTIIIADPKYVSLDFYITSSTPISFSVLDRTGLGIESTFYRIDGGNWIRYTTPFTISGDGPHIIYYNSTDMLGGVEETKTFDLIVDDTPPSSNIMVGAPNYTAVDLWIAPTTPIALSANDAGSGLSRIEYSLDGGDWQEYVITQPFPTPITITDEGSHTIAYRGIDFLGNAEMPKTTSFVVDGSPPWSTIDVGTPRIDVAPVEVYAETPFTITSTDNGSGVKVIQYRIDSEAWVNYSDSFNLSSYGPRIHTIEFRGTDNLGNLESTRSLSVSLIEPSVAEENLKPFIAIVFALILTILGFILTLRRPFVSKEGKERKAFTFMAVAFPLIIVEIVTGILSMFMSDIQVPPWLGLGVVIDMAILMAGLIVDAIVFSKNKRIGTEEETEEDF